MRDLKFNNRTRQLPDATVLFEEAHRCFEYREGRLYYKIDPRHPTCANSRVVGKLAGADDGHGYIALRLCGHTFKAHHVVWLMHTGAMPDNPLDHANGNRQDNRFENLREAAAFENSHNTTKIGRGQFKGVEKPKGKSFYVAKISLRGKKKYIGSFKTPEEAHAAYIEAKNKYAQEFSPYRDLS